MAEIKFKKTTNLPSSPTSADDGVYFVVDKDGVFSKIAVISGGVIKEYTSEGGGTPTLSEVLTEGNLIDSNFGRVIEFENPYGANNFIFNEDGTLMFGSSEDNGLTFYDDDSIILNSDLLRLNNQTFPSTAGTSGQVLTTNGTNMSWTTPSSDYSDLTNNVIPKKSPSDNALEDSNITDTATGVSVDGRTDTDLVIEKSVTATVGTSYYIDLNDPSGHYDLTLTGKGQINFSNMIGVNQSTVITLVVGGDYSLSFPSWLKPMPNNDDYKSTSPNELNLITILIRNGGSSPQGIYSLLNIEI